jgi:DNA-binding XRE family transcriptional regulator
MSDEPNSIPDRAKVLGANLRAVRERRGMGQSEVAQALGISRRNYVDAENGDARWSVGHIIEFANVVDCDVMALVSAVATGNPNIATLCIDNKLMTILMSLGINFEEEVGDGVDDLRPQELMEAVEKVLGELSQKLSERRVGQAWLARLLARFTGKEPKG